MKKPKIIEEVGFDFSWDVQKVWSLKVAVEEISIQELLWHFHIPFLWWGKDIYNLTPYDVLSHPGMFKEEYERVENVDLSYPIDIMQNKGRWLILDGLHRLMKAYMLNRKTVQVRKIPRNEIPHILK